MHGRCQDQDHILVYRSAKKKKKKKKKRIQRMLRDDLGNGGWIFGVVIIESVIDYIIPKTESLFFNTL